jgi:hypothetical protein
MKKKIYLCFVLSAALILLGISSGMAFYPAHIGDSQLTSLDNSSSAMAPWFIDTVVSTGNIGQHVSVAIDPGSGMTFISYYDQDLGGTLNLARYLGSSSNCGPDNVWHCQILDSLGSVGEYNSIATYPSGDGVKVIISYYDFTWGALKYIDGYAEASTFTFDTYTIDTGNPANGYSKGMHTSVKFDSAGTPHIAYQYNSTFTNEAQLYAYWVGDGTGNCGEGDVEGDWQCDTIFNDEGVGMYASLDIDGSDRPSIAFYDADNGYPWVASHIGSGGNCGPTNDWYCRSVHQAALDTGKYVSLVVEDSGLAHIAYYNASDETLEYATWVGSGGNCGFSSISIKYEWQCEWIDDMGTTLSPPMGISIALDTDGYPIIAYQDASDDLAPAALKLARPHVVLDPNIVPNCGPQDLFHLWYCGFIDTGGSFDVAEAGSVSMALNPAGLATIAYHEHDSYVYPSQGKVKIAYQRLQYFLPITLKE